MVGVWLAVTPGAARAGTYYWDGNGASPPSGWFSTNLNWNPNQVPGAADLAVFQLGSTYEVAFPYNQTTDSLEVRAGDVTLDSVDPHVRTYTVGSDILVDSGGLNIYSLILTTPFVQVDDGGELRLQAPGVGHAARLTAEGLYISDDGQVTVTDGARLTLNSAPYDWLVVGSHGTGWLTVDEGGEVESASLVVIAPEAYTTGNLWVIGPDSSLSVDLTLQLGPLGTGHLVITEGASADSGWGEIGKGDATVTGLDSSWTIETYLCVGTCPGPGLQGPRTPDEAAPDDLSVAERDGTGYLVIEQGGSVSVPNACAGCWRGVEPEDGFGNGYITVDSWGSLEISGSLDIGGSDTISGGVGSLTVTGGGTVTVGDTLTAWSDGPATNDGWVLVEDGLLQAGEILLHQGTLTITGGRVIADTISSDLLTSPTLTGGMLTVGEVYGDLVNDGGTIAPGTPIGSTFVHTAFTHNYGDLQIEITGTDSSEFDNVEAVWGPSIWGDLQVIFRQQFVPEPTDRFVILKSSLPEITGWFFNAERYVAVSNGGGFNVTYGPKSVALSNYRWQFPYRLLDNTTDEEDSAFIGPPDDYYEGIRDCRVDYDWGVLRVVDGPGKDFNVYQRDTGSSEFTQIDVLLSNDGTNWVSVKSTEGTMAARIPGDEAHGNTSLIKSYDLAGSGLGEVRYVRVAGTWYSGGEGFHLDAMGAFHLVERHFPTDISWNTTGQPNTLFLGAPDDQWVGIGGQIVEYDFGLLPVVDWLGPDFNIYEVDFGGPDFSLMDVFVSDDGENWVSVKGTEGPVVRIPGDEAHGNDNFARSYDLAGSGFSEVRYIRIDGNGDGPGGGSNGLDLDAIGAIHVPHAWPTPHLVSSNPADGWIDARVPIDPGTLEIQGWWSLEVTFDGDVNNLIPGDFAVTETCVSGACDGAAPGVSTVLATSGTTVHLALDRPIDPKAWTVITLQGGNATDRIRLGYLPADSDSSGTSNANDIVQVINRINSALGGGTPVLHQSDINRSGAVNVTDMIALINLLNGASPYPEAYFGKQLPALP